MEWNVPIGAARESLLALHKSLIDFERSEHEKRLGKRLTPGELLQLLTTDAAFDWLHPFSQLIVAIDELSEREAPPSERDAQAVRLEVEQLLDGLQFLARRARDPNIALEHGRTLAALEHLPVSLPEAHAELLTLRPSWSGPRRSRRKSSN